MYFGWLISIIKIHTYIKILKYSISDKVYLDDIKTCLIFRNAIHIKALVIDEFNCEFEDFGLFVKQTPNVKNLVICVNRNLDMIDACWWEHLITSSLLYLNIFKFKFDWCFWSRIKRDTW